jgi:hypothetical protein
MTTFEFRNVNDVDGLFRLIDNCNGPVYFKSEHGEKVDLRGNTIIKDLLGEAYGKNGIEKLSLEITDRKDRAWAINYLVGVA